MGVAALYLSACSVSTSAPPAAAGLSPAVQQAEAQSVMSPSQLIIALSAGAGPGTLESFVFGGPTITPACTAPVLNPPPLPSGHYFQIGYVSPAPPPPVRGVPSALFTVTTFYDSACAHPLHAYSFTLVKGSATTVTATGSETAYAATGAVTGYRTYDISDIVTATASNYVLRSTTAPGLPPVAPTSSFGLVCLYTVGSSENCGYAAVQNTSSLGIPLALNMNYTGLNPPGVATPSRGTVGMQAYTGAAGSMGFVLGSAAGTWTITGGTQIASDTGTYGFTVDTNGDILASATSLNDTTNDAAPSFTEDSAGNFSGLIRQISTGAVPSLFATDNAGNGSIIYTGAPVAPITEFLVQ
jgi:hypothetical protein